jgi:hypothetical protein
MSTIYIDGIIKDSSGQTLPGANIFTSDAQGNTAGLNGGFPIGTSSKADGSYSLSFPRDSYITVSYVGYQKQTKKFSSGNTNVNWELKPMAMEGKAFEIVAFKKLSGNDWMGLLSGLLLLILLAILAYKYFKK